MHDIHDIGSAVLYSFVIIDHNEIKAATWNVVTSSLIKVFRAIEVRIKKELRLVYVFFLCPYISYI